MTLIWSPEAIRDLQALRAYIALDNPGAARRMALHVIDSVESILPAHPNVGRPGRIPGTRELVIARSPFIVPYRLRDGRIEILRVYHAARKWPEAL